jgi:hypothetical protein
VTAAPTVACPRCTGLTFVVEPCQCLGDGDTAIVDRRDGARRGAGGAYPECRLCRGAGAVATACHRCAGRGRCRAQFVLTVANLDTGAVASAAVAPGTHPPRRGPDGVWRYELAPTLRVLARAAGVAGDPTTLTDGDGLTLGEPVVVLPAAWRPDLPAAERHDLEAAALAGSARRPWRVVVGRSTPPPPPVDPAARLAHLRTVADLLKLDLVVEVRRTGADAPTWHVRYETPGTPVPDQPHPAGYDLPAALRRTHVTDALDGLADRCLAAPAHLLHPTPPVVLPDTDVDRLAELLTGLLHPPGGARPPGAQAVWRDGRWWHTSLRAGPPETVYTERPTGQLTRRTRLRLHRRTEPPAPPWLGAPVPATACPDCDPGSNLRTCDCAPPGRPADPDCPRCCGAGRAPSALRCPTCGGTHRLPEVAQVTLTDLAHRVVHLTWQVGPRPPVEPVGHQPGGRPVVRLPDRYRLATWAPHFGVRPDDLTDLDGFRLDADLLDGTVTLPEPGADPVGGYVHAANRGQPAGRRIVLAVPPRVPSLAAVLRLALGLGLALSVSVVHHPPAAGDPTLGGGTVGGGTWWAVDLVGPGAPVDRYACPTEATVPAAVAYCLRYREQALQDAVPADPATALPVPQALLRDLPADPEPALRRLATHHPGSTVTVRHGPEGCRAYRHGRDGVRLLAAADTLPAALAVLGLGA